MDNGWIKIHRKLMKWEWYKKSEMVHLFLHFLLLANHEENKWQGKVIKKGQFITGRKQLEKEIGVSEQTIRTCIKRLKSTNEITTKPTNKFTLITIINWGQYQSKETKSTSKSTSTLTNNQPTTNQQLTTNKNVKNVKNEKNNIPPPLEEVKKYCLERNNGVDYNKWFNFYSSKGWMVGRNKMKDWKASVRTWEAKKTKAYVVSGRGVWG